MKKQELIRLRLRAVAYRLKYFATDLISGVIFCAVPFGIVHWLLLIIDLFRKGPSIGKYLEIDGSDLVIYSIEIFVILVFLGVIFYLIQLFKFFSSDSSIYRQELKFDYKESKETYKVYKNGGCGSVATYRVNTADERINMYKSFLKRDIGNMYQLKFKNKLIALEDRHSLYKEQLNHFNFLRSIMQRMKIEFKYDEFFETFDILTFENALMHIDNRIRKCILASDPTELDKYGLLLRKSLANDKNARFENVLPLPDAFLAEQDFSSFDFKNENLKGINFYKAKLIQADFQQANLQNAFLKNANLARSNLSYAYVGKADLSEVCLTDSNLTGANFEKTSLIRSDISKSKIDNARFVSANLDGVIFKESSLMECDFSDAKLSNSDFSATNLKRSKFKDTKLPNANFSFANLSGVDFSNANLSNSIFFKANLTKANFDNANLSNANLQGANLSKASMRFSNASDANLTETNLNGAWLLATDLTGADFSGSKLKNTKIESVSANKAKGLKIPE